jgi:hypothetical protein
MFNVNGYLEQIQKLPIYNADKVGGERKKKNKQKTSLHS